MNSMTGRPRTMVGRPGLGDSSAAVGMSFPPALLSLLNIGLAVLTAVLHGWIIWKLRTPEIRGEFVEPRSESFSR